MFSSLVSLTVFSSITLLSLTSLKGYMVEINVYFFLLIFVVVWYSFRCLSAAFHVLMYH